jgi:hypothetical protein
MENLTVFEAGARSPDGKYATFMESPEKSKIDDYLEIMKRTVPEDFELVFMEKTYRLISTTPNIINRK